LTRSLLRYQKDLVRRPFKRGQFGVSELKTKPKGGIALPVAWGHIK